MKITKSQLKQIINEEIAIVLEGGAFTGLGSGIAATGLGWLRFFQQLTGIGEKPWTHSGFSNVPTRQMDHLLQRLFKSSSKTALEKLADLSLKNPIRIDGGQEMVPLDVGTSSQLEIAKITGFISAKIVKVLGRPSMVEGLTINGRPIAGNEKIKMPLTEKDAKELGSKQSAESFLKTYFETLE